MTRRVLATICLGLALVMALGDRPARSQAPPLQVSASILPLADFCRQIGGERVEVQVLIPAGASPHTFEPSPGLLTGLKKSRVVVYIGAGLEPWMEKFLRTLREPKPTVVSAAQGLELIEAVHDHVRGDAVQQQGQPPTKKSGGHGHHHAHGAFNPHVWLDPLLAQDICRRIAAAFIAADPPGQETYTRNLTNYLAALTQLHQTILATTGEFRIRQFVSFHPSFSYFARRYDLKEAGVIEVAPGREPTPRALKNIIAAIGHYGINVIFSEPQFSPRMAEVLAQEAGVSVLALDPLGGRPPYGDNYLKLMEYNLQTMAQAMQ
jgi:zinc transport system substrate-binding protein